MTDGAQRATVASKVKPSFRLLAFLESGRLTKSITSTSRCTAKRSTRGANDSNARCAAATGSAWTSSTGVRSMPSRAMRSRSPSMPGPCAKAKAPRGEAEGCARTLSRASDRPGHTERVGRAHRVHRAPGHPVGLVEVGVQVELGARRDRRIAFADRRRCRARSCSPRRARAGFPSCSRHGRPSRARRRGPPRRVGRGGRCRGPIGARRRRRDRTRRCRRPPRRSIRPPARSADGARSWPGANAPMLLGTPTTSIVRACSSISVATITLPASLPLNLRHR